MLIPIYEGCKKHKHGRVSKYIKNNNKKHYWMACIYEWTPKRRVKQRKYFPYNDNSKSSAEQWVEDNKIDFPHQVIAYSQVDDDISEMVLKHRWHMSSGYGHAVIDGEAWFLHRFVYKNLCGELSDKENIIDHIDRNKLNNLKNNLRLTNKSINRINSEITRNKTGYKCVYYNTHREHYYAQVCRKNIGTFNNPIDAAKAVNEAYKKVFPGEIIPNPEVEI